MWETLRRYHVPANFLVPNLQLWINSFVQFSGSFIFLAIEGGASQMQQRTLASTNRQSKAAQSSRNNNNVNLLNNPSNSQNMTFSSAALKDIAEVRDRCVENIWDVTVSLNVLYRENWTRWDWVSYEFHMIKFLMFVLNLLTVDIVKENSKFAETEIEKKLFVSEWISWNSFTEAVKEPFQCKFHWIPIAINSQSLESFQRCRWMFSLCWLCRFPSLILIRIYFLVSTASLTLVIAIIRVSMLSTSPSANTKFKNRNFLNSFPVCVPHHRLLQFSSFILWVFAPSSSTYHQTLISLLFGDLVLCLCRQKWMEKFCFL